MELKDFVSETIKQIIDGVKEAQEYARTNDAKINPEDLEIYHNTSSTTLYKMHYSTEPVYTIEFDVAVTTQENIDGKGKVGVFAGMFKAGVEGGVGSQNGSISKIKFHIPIALPKQK